MSRCHAAAIVFGFFLRKRYEVLRKREGVCEGLTKFDADKSMRLLDKLWEHRRNKAPRERQGRMVDFPVNRDFNDKHGHRIAYAAASEPGTARPVLFRPVLQVMQCFDEHSTLSGRLLTQVDQETLWGHVSVLRPEVSAAALMPLLECRALDNSDVFFLENLGEVCGELDDREVIAIGRHENAHATAESILWELRRWTEWAIDAFQALDGFITGSQTNTNFIAEALWQCWSFALEAKKKAALVPDDVYGSDRRFYDSAEEKLCRAVTVSGMDAQTKEEILHSLKSAQRPGCDIWGDPRVTTLRFAAFSCWAFSSYMAGAIRDMTSFTETLLVRRLASLSKEEVRDAFRTVQRCVQVARCQRPADFSPQWLTTQSFVPCELATRLVRPDALWDGSSNLSEFVAPCKEAGTWLMNEHVEPEIQKLRVQEA